MSVEIEQDALYMMPLDPQYPLSFTVNRRQKPINREVAPEVRIMNSEMNIPMSRKKATASLSKLQGDWLLSSLT